MKINLIFLFLLFSFQIYSSHFEHELNHHTHPIKKLKLCGERCSGTNYAYHLVHQNFPTLRPTNFLELGHKHFLPWIGFPCDEQKMSDLKYGPDAFDLNHSDDCLFLVVIRDPYDWLRSFYETPWFVHVDNLGKGFFHFLT